MNQNNKNRVKEFLRKEGFYFVLFLCLCVVASVAALTMKKNNADKQPDKANSEFTLKVDESEDADVSSNGQKQNAERVENNSEDQSIADNTAEDEIAAETEEDGAEVANTTEVTLLMPLEGTVSRSFGTMIRVQESNQGIVDTTRRGVDIQAAVGTAVTAAAEGRVVEISSSTEEGTYIVIEHANGLSTKYANLDPQVSVAVGDVVTAGTQIGLVGNSSQIFTSQLCGDVLNLQVEDANGNQVDPAKYFNF